jgi:hypothetical protein
VDREELRRLAGRLPFSCAFVWFGTYLVDERLLGNRGGGLAAVGVVFVSAVVISWVLRRGVGDELARGAVAATAQRALHEPAPSIEPHR